MKRNLSLVISMLFLTLLLSKPANAYSIRDDQMGGDCYKIGTWEADTKICTMTTSVGSFKTSPEISIDSDGITLDGNGYQVYSWKNIYNIGIYADNHKDVTIKNIAIYNFYIGISLQGSHSSRVENVTVTAANLSQGSGILISGSDNIVTQNLVSNNYYCINLIGSGHTVERNTVTGCVNTGLKMATQGTIIDLNDVKNSHVGIFVYGGSLQNDNAITNNYIEGNDFGLYNRLVTGLQVSGNTLINNNYGYYVYWTTWSSKAEVDSFNNNFIDNQYQAYEYLSANIWYKPAPIGGNYWSDYDTEEEGCFDNNNDGFCDAPYLVYKKFDYLPLTKPHGLCDTIPEIIIDAYSPNVIWPPNGKMVDVNISGHVINPNDCTLQDVSFSMIDEYAEYSSADTLSLEANGYFSITLSEQAAREGDDLNGRTYTFQVVAVNEAGEGLSPTVDIIVPHDQAH